MAPAPIDVKDAQGLTDTGTSLANALTFLFNRSSGDSSADAASAADIRKLIAQIDVEYDPLILVDGPLRTCLHVSTGQRTVQSEPTMRQSKAGIHD